jgi:putative endonuclease
MNWYCYILYSTKLDRYYIGYTDNLEWRLERHNSGWGKYTQKGIVWELVYIEEYDKKDAAMKREKKIKKMKSRKYIEGLIS